MQKKRKEKRASPEKKTLQADRQTDEQSFIHRTHIQGRGNNEIK